MKNRKLIGATLAACALAGATAGIAQSATGKHAKSTRYSTEAPAGGMPGPGPGMGMGMGGGPGGGAVHSVSEVLDKAGSAFIAQTTDSGTIKSVDSSAQTITIAEGMKSVTYGTPTITIPSGATVTLDGKSSSLSALAAGDHVSVSSSSDGTTVFAADSSFRPRGAGPGHAGGPPPSGAPQAAPGA